MLGFSQQARLNTLLLLWDSEHQDTVRDLCLIHVKIPLVTVGFHSPGERGVLELV